MNWELGEEVVYDKANVLGPRKVTLAQATRWPDDMTDREAEFYARLVEHRANARLGFIPCEDDQHELAVVLGFACPKCRAVV